MNMGYNKFIKSGNQLELYEYENDNFGNRTTRRGVKRKPTRQELANDREDVLSFSKSLEFTRRRDNAQRARNSFRRIVLSNLCTTENPLLVTLTFGENRTSLSESAKFFHIFTVRLRQIWGNEFRYIAVPEFQKRGAVHYHALFWGVPDNTFIQERKTRFLAKLWGQGFIFLKETDGHEKLSTYLAKYMVKTIKDPRLFNSKAYFASRNIKRPIVSGGFPKWWFEEEFAEELSTFGICLKKEFMTQWLGKGRYTLFVK